MTESIETLFEKTEDYVTTSVELLKLQSIEKTSDVVSSLASQLVIIIVVAMFTLTANIGIALWLGQLLGKTYYGFFCVAGFYGLVATVVYIFRDKWIKTPLQNSLIMQMLKGNIKAQ